MHIERMHKMIECLTEKALCEFDKGIENIDTCEMGQVVDMIKDLNEAEYKAVIVKSMKEADEEEKEYYLSVSSLISNECSCFEISPSETPEALAAEAEMLSQMEREDALFKVSIDAVRLCMRKQWFTNGDTYQYETMQQMIRDDKPLHDIAVVTWFCSKDTTLEEVEAEFKELYEKRNLFDK